MKMSKKTGYSSNWISLTDAVVHVSKAVGEDNSWSEIKRAIRDGELVARGILDGIDGNVKGEWLSILAFNDPEGDTLWFAIDKRHRFEPPAPTLAERMEVESDKLESLWSGLSLDENSIKTKSKRGRKIGAYYRPMVKRLKFLENNTPGYLDRTTLKRLREDITFSLRKDGIVDIPKTTALNDAIKKAKLKILE